VNREIIDQVDVQAICKKHNIGRYELIRFATTVSRGLELSPHDAFKRMLEIDDLNTLEDLIRNKRLSKELKKF
tara:strand:+ start:254 stop:472 length:219 start_codon:yes stop_codon:yes gene_type:complete